MRTSMLVSLIVLATLAGQLVMPAMARPNIITIIVKQPPNKIDHVAYPVSIRIYDVDNTGGESNYKYFGQTNAYGKLVLTNGADVVLLPGKTYIVDYPDFGEIGRFKVNHAGGGQAVAFLDI